MVDLDKIYYIFYTPGSCGTLLSLLIRSQIDGKFTFAGFENNTAHQYKQNAIAKTHSYYEYKDFLQSGVSIEQHLRDNQYNDSWFQRCHPQWINAIQELDLPNLILCYLSDKEMKANNMYIKERQAIIDAMHKTPINFKIDKGHKDIENLLIMKMFKLYTEEENKHLHSVKSVNMNRVLEKEFSELSNCCEIKDRTLLEEIIDEYNAKQKPDKLPISIKTYLKKYHNSI
jgi:hypothetical protein